MLGTAGDAVQEFRQRTEEKVRNLRCPRHRQAPRVKFNGSTLRDVTIRMSACCDTLIQMANQAIANQAIAKR